MAPMGISISINDVSKKFGERTALRKVSANAASGRVLVVTGQNGTGKSTLLKVVAGLIRPSTGEVRYSDGTSTGDAARFRDRIGFISPELALYEELTALDNLAFFAGLKGVQDPVAAGEALLKRVGLLDRADDPLGSFSSGMKQRVKFCFSLVNDPDVWLIDEPTANLDDPGKELVYSLISERRRRSAIIIATNEKEEVPLGDEAVILGK